VICSAWRFQGGCCRSYNCSLRSVIDFLRSPLERPSMANIFTPPPDFFFMSCRDGFTNHYWFTSPLAHESPKPTPSYVYIACSSVFPFYVDIIPNPYLPPRLSNGLCSPWTTPNVGFRWPLSCVAPLRIRWNVHHFTPFDPKFPSIRERILVYFLASHFHPLVHTARPILPDISDMSTYPYFNCSYLPYQ
jgi:hypothetical protein